MTRYTLIPYTLSKIIGNNTLLLGECRPYNGINAVKIRVHRLIFDTHLKCHFKHFADVLVDDPDRLSKVGDTVLIRKLETPKSVDVSFKLEKVVVKFGDVTCDVSGRKVAGVYFRDDLKMKSDLLGYGDKDVEKMFDYDRAPDRGWQEGRKDYSHKEFARRFHEFPESHPLHNDPSYL